MVVTIAAVSRLTEIQVETAQTGSFWGAVIPLSGMDPQGGQPLGRY